MNTRKLINQTPVDEWELLNETVGRRPGPGTPLFEPHELGYACPVCDASDEVNLTWSEFNGMIWCHNCKEDWPSCICKAYPEPKISHRKLTKFQKARDYSSIMPSRNRARRCIITINPCWKTVSGLSAVIFVAVVCTSVRLINWRRRSWNNMILPRGSA